MSALSIKVRACTLCALLVVFTACEYAPAPTSTPLPTVTSQPTTVPTDAPPTPTSAATAEAPAAAQVVATSDASVGGTAEAAEIIKARVSVSSVRVRDTPSIRGKTLGQLQNNDEVIVLSKTADSGYIYIENADGSLKGWSPLNSFILENLVANIPVATPTP